MYWGSNRKSRSGTESKKWVAAIFLLPVWPLVPYGQAFSSFFAVYSRHFACGGSGISFDTRFASVILLPVQSNLVIPEVVIEMLLFTVFRSPLMAAVSKFH